MLQKQGAPNQPTPPPQRNPFPVSSWAGDRERHISWFQLTCGAWTHWVRRLPNDEISSLSQLLFKMSVKLAFQFWEESFGVFREVVEVTWSTTRRRCTILVCIAGVFQITAGQVVCFVHKKRWGHIDSFHVPGVLDGNSNTVELHDSFLRKLIPEGSRGSPPKLAEIPEPVENGDMACAGSSNTICCNCWTRWKRWHAMCRVLKHHFQWVWESQQVWVENRDSPSMCTPP